MQYERAIAFSVYSKTNENKFVDELEGILEEWLKENIDNNIGMIRVVLFSINKLSKYNVDF